ncbi:MAG: ABC transporter permease [candidate division WOR-3 bacterium]|nr:ABC transporter permease [candidate division WOR-3 bacterium]
MAKFLNILQKEIKDLLTLRMILPFLLSIFILFFMGRIMERTIERALKPTAIGVVDHDKTGASLRLIEGLKKSGNVVVVLNEDDELNAIQRAKENGLLMVVVIPGGYESNLKDKKVTEIKLYSIITALSITASAQRTNIKNFLKTINQQVAESFVRELAPDLNMEVLREPVKAKEFVVLRDIIQPGNTSFIIAYISTQTTIIPVALLMLIIITGTMIASSIAQEKENKTLETILTVPVSRFTIILAKMLAAVILAILFALFFVIAMGSFTSSFGAMEKNNLVEMPVKSTAINLGLDSSSKFLLIISIFLAIANALGMATLLALFAQDVKDAQNAIMPLTIMILIPYFFSMAFDPGMMSPGLKIFTFLIPFSHTFFAFKFLLLGQKLYVALGNLYLLIFAFVLLFTTTRVFASEKILTMKFTWGKFRRRL